MNWASVELGCKIVGVSSQMPACEATNLLDSDISKIWLSDYGLPQWLCISLKDVQHNYPVEVRCVGWHCWHSYSTNPKEIRLHVSKDGTKFRVWDTFVAKRQKGNQIFCCSPINADVYPFIAMEILSTFGGTQAYMNRLFLFAEEISGSFLSSEQSMLHEYMNDDSNDGNEPDEKLDFIEKNKARNNRKARSSSISDDSLPLQKHPMVTPSHDAYFSNPIKSKLSSDYGIESTLTASPDFLESLLLGEKIEIVRDRQNDAPQINLDDALGLTNHPHQNELITNAEHRGERNSHSISSLRTDSNSELLKSTRGSTQRKSTYLQHDEHESSLIHRISDNVQRAQTTHAYRSPSPRSNRKYSPTPASRHNGIIGDQEKYNPSSGSVNSTKSKAESLLSTPAAAPTTKHNDSIILEKDRLLRKILSAEKSSESMNSKSTVNSPNVSTLLPPPQTNPNQTIAASPTRQDHESVQIVSAVDMRLQQLEEKLSLLVKLIPSEIQSTRESTTSTEKFSQQDSVSSSKKTNSQTTSQSSPARSLKPLPPAKSFLSSDQDFGKISPALDQSIHASRSHQEDSASASDDSADRDELHRMFLYNPKAHQKLKPSRSPVSLLETSNKQFHENSRSQHAQKASKSSRKSYRNSSDESSSDSDHHHHHRYRRERNRRSESRERDRGYHNEFSYKMREADIKSAHSERRKQMNDDYSEEKRIHQNDKYAFRHTSLNTTNKEDFRLPLSAAQSGDYFHMQREKASISVKEESLVDENVQRLLERIMLELKAGKFPASVPSDEVYSILRNQMLKSTSSTSSKENRQEHPFDRESENRFSAARDEVEIRRRVNLLNSALNLATVDESETNQNYHSLLEDNALRRLVAERLLPAPDYFTSTNRAADLSLRTRWRENTSNEQHQTSYGSIRESVSSNHYDSKDVEDDEEFDQLVTELKNRIYERTVKETQLQLLKEKRNVHRN